MNQDNAQWIDRYEVIAKDPYSWLRKARNLIYDAYKVLTKEDFEGRLQGFYSPVDTFMMLSSFAIEDIIKSIIVKKNPAVIDNGKIDKIILKRGHDLLKLSETAVITFTSTEKDLLNRLYHFAVETGRYPVPKFWQKFRDSSRDVHKAVFMSEDTSTIIDIISTLQNELKRIGLDFNIYDMSYSYIKDGKKVFVEKRISPYRYFPYLVKKSEV